MKLILVGLLAVMAVAAPRPVSQRYEILDLVKEMRANLAKERSMPRAERERVQAVLDDLEDRARNAVGEKELDAVMAEFRALSGPGAPATGTAPAPAVRPSPVSIPPGDVTFDNMLNQRALGPVAARQFVVSANGASDGPVLTPRRPPVRTAAPPTPPAGTETGGWREFFDLNRAKALAQRSLSRLVGFTGRCYKWVADAMESLGFFSSADSKGRRVVASWPPEIGGESAYMFARLKKMPAVMKRIGVAPFDLKERPLPIGTTLVYQPGCMGFHKRHGHIEVVCKNGEKRADSFYACSDGGTWRTNAWLDQAVSRRCVDAFIPVKAQPPH